MIMDVARTTKPRVELPALADYSCVDRRLVHRAAMCEVFLTDSAAVDETTFVVGAQLPTSHAYYTDYTGRADIIDPLLLLECCRQAETLVAHKYLKVPHGQHFILRSWDMSFPGLREVAAVSAPATLRLAVFIESPRYLVGVLRSLTYRITIFADLPTGKVQIGWLSMDVMYATPAAYRALRARRRKAQPVTSLSVPDAETSHPVAPALVARSSELNVVVADVRPHMDGVRALLRPQFRNPSMFDHAQDHVPAMVLSEAARQLALVALADIHGVSAMHTYATAISGSFREYVELDSPADLVMDRPSPPGRSSDDLCVDTNVSVRVEQRSNVAATLELTLRTSPGPSAGRGGDS